ncbi:MAG: SDR family NAD(P)-dependent oxidoreductase [Rhodobacteraceae bacterium]|nr:SDR family NAD(P)-dependent oxidoreductase [Paracoccaceae bacterium]
MRRFTGKRYWIVGASEGLGRALALKLSKAGAEVIVSARSAERLEALVAELPGPGRAVACDVADAESVKRAAAEAGEVDGMVYLAGLYWPMKATEWDAGKVATMVDVNLTGAARVVGEVLPGMLARKHGHIVLTGSLSGFRGLPGAIGYGATKAGIMSLGETMRIDLKGTGVVVQNANPGFIRTRLTDKNDFKMPFLMEPEAAADHMMTLMRSDRFSSSFPWLFGAWFRFSQFLPDWLYYRIY